MLHVNRVIFALTPNPLYVPYWSVISRVWHRKFGVTPTLIFNGSQSELDACGLSTEHGEIFRVDSIPDVVVNRQRDWSCTWSLFYGASLFPNDVCMLSGIDQMPLGGMFFDAVRGLPADAYAIGFGDAYRGTYYPSSHHVAKGSRYKEMFGIDSDWKTEVTKVFATRPQWPNIDPVDAWGLDEIYSSALLQRRGDFTPLSIFWHPWQSARLVRESVITAAVLAEIANNQKSEWHMPRPFSCADPVALAKVETAIPTYTWT